MQLLQTILLIYLVGFAFTLVLLLWRNANTIRHLTPHQLALVRATLRPNPFLIKDRDLLQASAIWPFVLLVLANDLARGHTHA